MSYRTNLNKTITITQDGTSVEIPIERARLKAQLDDFATFQWRGCDMFDKFGCFIINEQKGGLKFYNGPGYTNQYAKPQFSTSVNGLLGVDFKQQTISMKVGLYWFTIEEYQQFLNFINPYEVNYLSFGYANNYGYLVKMGKIADSTRYIVGSDGDGNRRYYTELDLTWELLGDTCVRANYPYEYTIDTASTDNELTWVFSTQQENGESSLLDTPMMFEVPLKFTNLTEQQNTATLKLIAKYDNDEPIELFDIELQNLLESVESTSQNPTATIYEHYSNTYQMFLRYDSETGLIYIQEGSNDTWHLLNYQTDNNSGAYLLKSAEVFKWKMPGTFSAPNKVAQNWKFVLTTTRVDTNTIKADTTYIAPIIYARKNIV